MKRKSNPKAQSFLEYAVVVAVVAAAMVGGKIYFTRSLQEKHRQGADAFGGGEQYALGITIERDLSPQGTNYGGVNQNDDTNIDCGVVNNRVNTLQDAVNSLRSQANTLEQSAGGIGMILGGTSEGADTLREQARALRAEADAKEAEIAQYRTDYPDCF